MLSPTLALAADETVRWAGPGFGWWLLFPLFWILFFVLLFAFVGRRWRRRWGPGPWAYGDPRWAGGHGGSRSAESTLAERFANGDIDEVEYRARLEVLRANRDVPPRS
jgi:putative membrane protein